MRLRETKKALSLDNPEQSLKICKTAAIIILFTWSREKIKKGLQP
jgi:hypothetical protein